MTGFHFSFFRLVVLCHHYQFKEHDERDEVHVLDQYVGEIYLSMSQTNLFLQFDGNPREKILG